MLSKHCPDGRGALGARGPERKWSKHMSNLMNRILDLTVSFAVLGLTLTIAGATAFLGA